jgi:CheY-like chemotaxis protein
MENLAVLSRSGSPEQHPRVQLLVADDDAAMRSLLVSCARDTVDAIAVLEAEDGAEAVRIGLRYRPQIALVDINMPKLGGIDVALKLRALEPRIRVALQTGEPDAHRARARAHRLPLFDKLELDRTLSWLEVQAQSCVDRRLRPRLPKKRTLQCCTCGYGITCRKPPERCPMCHAEDAWIHAPWSFRGRDVGRLDVVGSGRSGRCAAVDDE